MVRGLYRPVGLILTSWVVGTGAVAFTRGTKHLTPTGQSESMWSAPRPIGPNVSRTSRTRPATIQHAHRPSRVKTTGDRHRGFVRYVLQCLLFACTARFGPRVAQRFTTVDLHLYLHIFIQTLGTRSRDRQATFGEQLDNATNTFSLCELREDQAWFQSEYLLSTPTRGNNARSTPYQDTLKHHFPTVISCGGRCMWLNPNVFFPKQYCCVKKNMAVDSCMLCT